MYVQGYKGVRDSIRRLAKLVHLRKGLPNRRVRDDNVVLNWGSTERDGPWRYINDPSRVTNAVDKLECYQILKDAGVPVPRFTTDKTVAQKWIDKGHKVFARKLTRASGGRGIVISGPDGPPLPNAPLYVRYLPKKYEYRVHVFLGKVIDFQQKKLQEGWPKTDNTYAIRNRNNGWVYCREGVELPIAVEEAAVHAVVALDLDFGAVDVGLTENTLAVAVYEVNTAPGLFGTTLEKYAEVVRAYRTNVRRNMR